MTYDRHVAVVLFGCESERGKAKGKVKVKREAVRAFAFLLALAVEEAGLALSNADSEAVSLCRGEERRESEEELEHVTADGPMAVRT
jgi:hypothetical protein